MKDSEIVRSCETCVSRCSTPMKTCLAENFLLYRPDFALLARTEDKTEEAPQKEADENTLSDEQAWLYEKYVNDDPRVKKRKEQSRKWNETRKRKRETDAAYAEHEKEMAKARYWKDPEKARSKRNECYSRQASTEEGRSAINARQRNYMRSLRRSNPEKHSEILRKKKEYNREYYRNQTDEQRLKHNARSYRYYTIKLATESPEEREARLVKERAKRRRRLERMTPEELQQYTDRKNARRRELRAIRREQKKQ